MNSLSTIRRINELAAKRAAITPPEPTDAERQAMVAEAHVNNARPVLSDHDQSLMKPGETVEEFLQRREDGEV